MDKVSEIVDYLKKEKDRCKFELENISVQMNVYYRYTKYALEDRIRFIDELLNKINAKEN